MNYQHAFHAGNFADVHKHAVLLRILDHLRIKPAPFRVIESHAGAGRYDLHGAQAARSGEWQNGIGKIVAAYRHAALGADVAALLEHYLGIVAAFNPDRELRFYPGSPLIAQACLRPNDRLIACEIEPRAALALGAALRGDRRAKILSIDGWMAVNTNVPPPERRGLVLADPPYEDAGDFTRLCAMLAAAHRKWPTGIYMMWYPVKQRDAADALARRLRRLGIAKILRCELSLSPPRPDAGLTGSGLMIVNPPFPLFGELQVLLPVLGRILSADASHRVDWLRNESPA
jgi:23S rRNA (adenine2030-N6)-methyltransferase